MQECGTAFFAHLAQNRTKFRVTQKQVAVYGDIGEDVVKYYVLRYELIYNQQTY